MIHRQFASMPSINLLKKLCHFCHQHKPLCICHKYIGRMQACSLIYLGVNGKLTLNKYTKLINEIQDQLVLIGRFDIILNFAGVLSSLGCHVFGLLTGWIWSQNGLKCSESDMAMLLMLKIIKWILGSKLCSSLAHALLRQRS